MPLKRSGMLYDKTSRSQEKTNPRSSASQAMLKTVSKKKA